MKKNLFVASCVAVFIAIFSTGCTSIEASKVGNPVTVHMPVRIKPTVETKNTMISGSATVHSILGIFTWGPNAQAVGISYGGNSVIFNGVLGDLFSFTSQSEIVARNAAAYNATTSADADIILAPQYVLTTEDYFVYKSINCKVKGFPGYIKGVKVIDTPVKKDCKK